MAPVGDGYFRVLCKRRHLPPLPDGLYQQPFGFSQTDVDLLRHAVEYGQIATWTTDRDGKDIPFVAHLRSLAARLQALLPPETP